MNHSVVGKIFSIHDKAGAHQRKVTAEVAQYGARYYELIDIATGKCHTAYADTFDKMFLAPKGKVTPGKHYKGKSIRHSQLKGVI